MRVWSSMFGLGLLCLLTLGLAAGPAFAENAAGGEESWQSIYISGQRVGFAHVQIRDVEREGRSLTVSDTLSQMTIRRFGISLKMSVQQTTEEDADGNLLSYRFSVINPPLSKTESRGEIVDGQLQLTTLNSGIEKTSTAPWDAAVKSPAWIERVLEIEPLEAGQSRTFKMFDPQFTKVAEMTLTHRGEEETELLDGSRALLEKIESRHSLVPGLVLTSYVDSKGETRKSVTNLMDMTTFTVTKEEALKEISPGDLDIGMDTVIKTGPIPNVHKAERGVYVVTTDGPAAGILPEGATQSVTQTGDRSLELTVRAIRPGDAGEEPAPGPEYLAASRFLDTDDPVVRELANEGAGAETDPAKLAVKLEKFVHAKVKDKNFSTALATASEVARELSGDCTEHAVLLAAALRVRDVPSRVVIGFVYADSIGGFGGHMWTEAYINGTWVPLDATLGLGGIGVGHIKVTDADLAENSAAPVGAFVPIIHLLGKTQIKPGVVE
ncbi:MAG: transglutaminase family protein [Planctomyces sp.]|nr:transglutaminase family protein [Planctomyces sp.]